MDEVKDDENKMDFRLDNLENYGIVDCQRNGWNGEMQ